MSRSDRHKTLNWYYSKWSHIPFEQTPENDAAIILWVESKIRKLK